MDNVTWIIDIPTEIFMLVKTRAQAQLNNLFPNALWTMDDSLTIEPIFPTIFMSFECSEVGMDLNAQDINGINCVAQVDITVTKEQGIENARYISSIVVAEFKKLGFEITEAPMFRNTVDLKSMIFVARRIIGQADIINS